MNRTANQHERGLALWDIVKTFSMPKAAPGGLAWGKDKNFIQGSLRHVDGLVTDLRISNTWTTTWAEGLSPDGSFLYHLPTERGAPLGGADKYMLASRGQKVTLRISIFPPPTSDFVGENMFVVDPAYAGGLTCRLIPA